MNTGFYKLTALTNLHPGSGDLSYGVIDKLVQRDPASGFPVIHASGMKGALKEYCLDILGYPEDSDKIKDSDNIIKQIFGNDKHPGKNKFFSAHLLTIPVRSNHKPFYRATCPAIMEHIAQFLESFGMNANSIKTLIEDANECLNSNGKEFAFINNSTTAEIYLEDWCNGGKIDFNDWDTCGKIFGDLSNFAILRDDIFLQLCEDLPVIARNRLEEPKNLWYEELIPRMSEFWFVHMYPNDSEKIIHDLMKQIAEKKTPVQIGANASIGQGYCSITEIPII